jgi:hypothetical protein
MANSLLTPTVILKEAGRLFHQKARFIPAINREYDDKFAQSGAKVGYSIALRDRNQYTVTTGATLAVQDTTEASQTLTVNTQKHIGLNFTSADLTMVIDEFSDRYLKPAMAALVANVEADALISMRKQVANFVDSNASAFAFLDVGKGKQFLDEYLTPPDERSLLLCPTHATKYMDAVKGLVVPGGKLGNQYSSGIVEDVTGFSIGGTTHLTAHQTGTAVATTGYSVDNSGTTSGATITLKTGSTTFLKGDVITIATLNAVHPESKADLGRLQHFVVTADSGVNATSLSIRPSIVYTGAKKNVSTSSLGADRAVVKVGNAASASGTNTESLAFHKDAFIFGTADLEDMSKYGGWGAREVMDGVSMRIWRQGDIVNDAAPCRIDVLYGFLARYPQMAVRICANG